jgi:hypothetical protein
MPSCALAWMSSSWTIRSPRCGSVAKSAALAAKPVGKKSAASLP